MSRFLRLAFVFGSAAFFAVMWGRLLRAHLPSAQPPPFRPDYARLLAEDQESTSAEWDVYFADQRVGKCMTAIERTSTGQITLQANTLVSVGPLVSRVLGVSGDLDLAFRAGVSPLRGLQSFDAESRALDTVLRGAVLRGEIMLSGDVGGERVNARVPFEEDALLGGALSPLAGLPQLDERSVGTSWRLHLVNPIVGRLEEVIGTVMGYRTVLLDGKETDVFQVRFMAGSNQWTSWVTSEGDALVQGTPFGITLRRADVPSEVIGTLSPEP